MAQSLRVSKNRSVFDPNVVAFSGALGSTYNFHDEIESHWMGSLRGRLGTFIGGSLLYITGGLALTTLEYKHSYSDNSALLGLERSSTSKSVLGWTLGAGLEMPLSRTMSLRTEYMFTDFSDMKTPNSNVFPLANPGQALCSSATLNQCFHNRGDLGIHQIRLGLNFKLGNDPAPAPLK